MGLGLRGNQVSSVRAKSACQAAGLAGRRNSAWVGAITWVKVIVPKRSSRVRQASSAAGTAAASMPRAGMPSGPLEMIKRRQPGCSPLPRDHRDSLPLSVEHQDWHFTTETE